MCISDWVRTVCYGEELPVDEGHNNEAWAKNRRVNVIYEVELPN
jgi:peptidoglycan-associated lipoprotein